MLNELSNTHYRWYQIGAKIACVARIVATGVEIGALEIAIVALRTILKIAMGALELTQKTIVAAGQATAAITAAINRSISVRFLPGGFSSRTRYPARRIQLY